MKKINIQDNDSILDIISKIESEKDKSNLIYLEVDNNNVIKNFLNLKLIIFRFPSKKFHIITSNSEIKKIGEKLDIKYFYKNDDIEFEEKFSKTNILKYNFTFFEYLIYEIKKLFLYVLFILKNRTVTYKNKKLIKDSNFFFLIVGIIISLSLLAFIFYFAVSKTYIYITPELGIKTISRNIIYSEKENSNIFDNKNVILAKNIGLKTDLNYSFHVSTIDPESAKRAYGVVELFNELKDEQIFKPNTRFITDDGIVFRSTNWIKIPGSTKTGSGEFQIGKAEFSLMADIYDTEGKIIGTRGNIGKDIVLTIPGLKFNRDKIYAKSKTNFLGGLDPKIHILTQEELDKFKQIIIEKVKAKALGLLKEKIKTTNSTSESNFQIIPIDNIIKYSSGTVEVLNNTKVLDKIDEVVLKGVIDVNTYVFNKESLMVYLKNILNESLLAGTEKIMSVNENSLKITNILSKTENPFYLKATTELDSTISYNFEDKNNNLTKKLKNLIINTTEKEATSILLNDTNIASVKIKFSPFWLTRVSSNPDNIDFIIQK